MVNFDENLQHLMDNLNERAKELNCLYRVDEILREPRNTPDNLMARLIELIPAGWQFCELCSARIELNDEVSQSEDYQETPWFQQKDIVVNNRNAGSIRVTYSAEKPFLVEEDKLLQAIADKIGHYLERCELRQAATQWQQLKSSLEVSTTRSDWKVIVDMLYSTDIEAYLRTARKMMNYLYWIGNDEAVRQIEAINFDKLGDRIDEELFANKPTSRTDKNSLLEGFRRVFEIAGTVLSSEEILTNLHKWMQEDRISFLVVALEDLATSLSDIQNALARFHTLGLNKIELTEYTRKNINVLLILRFFTDQLEFINIAKNFIYLESFQSLIQHMIFPNNSHGKLGGKSAGIFLAKNILNTEISSRMHGIDIKYPKTWYITSDTMHRFLYYNNLKEIIEQKYKDIEQIREEYANIIQMFKNSQFPPEIIKELSRALDDFGDSPIIVRSSSLLEDRVGAAFSGKYKSLFLANQGSKTHRLNALMDAISEVYASTFGPDPIVYRKERGLLDFHEEMAIIIQEVVGARAGKYFFPAFAGVAFSNNEFRWSPRIKREDGLIRLVPGLGTRAVDRLSNDYPILVAPGCPDLHVNATNEEILRYSPKMIDLINLEENTFETLPVEEVMRACGEDYPMVEQIVSVYHGSAITSRNRFNINFAEDDIVVTFHGLANHRSRDYMRLLKDALAILKDKMGVPVDIEFACDGNALYLLQCRSQSADHRSAPAAIPKDIPEQEILFTANRYISNGSIPEITHLVYVDPQKYSEIQSLDELKAIGKAVGKLNAILPKRKFILMGPGRWGSRGDIKLGVNVTYADISNSAVLIEIARKKGQYTPDLSFGTHFFQDLVESSIRYIPLYPDEADNMFNERFLQSANNILGKILPEHEELTDTLKVIDVPASTSGKNLRILMNADLDEALAYFSSEHPRVATLSPEPDIAPVPQDNHWLWRYRMAEKIARLIDVQRFGVKNFYIFGSVKNATAGPASDIDLLIHVEDDSERQRMLDTWLEGWSKCLAEMNYLRTGYHTEGLLDVHLITDEDIKNRSSFAARIDAITDAARPLSLTEK